MDFFDDEIDSIRTFNVETQLSEQKCESISILPPTLSQKSEGISLLEFMGKETLIFCKSPLYILDRIKAISEEEFSASAIIEEEGD